MPGSGTVRFLGSAVSLADGEAALVGVRPCGRMFRAAAVEGADDVVGMKQLASQVWRGGGNGGAHPRGGRQRPWCFLSTFWGGLYERIDLAKILILERESRECDGVFSD